MSTTGTGLSPVTPASPATPAPAWPGWLRDVDSLLAVHPHFVLWGNVRDYYPLPGPVPMVTDSVGMALAVTMAPSGYDVILRHDVIDGYSVLGLDEAAGWAAVHAVTGRDLRAANGRDLPVLAEVLRAVARPSPRRMAVLLDYVSQISLRPQELHANEHELFRVATKLSHTAVRSRVDNGRTLYNPVFWLVQREHDLPAWYTAGNPGVRTIQVPLPDLAERERVAHMLLAKVEEPRRSQVAEKLAAGTDGLGIDPSATSPPSSSTGASATTIPTTRCGYTRWAPPRARGARGRWPRTCGAGPTGPSRGPRSSCRPGSSASPGLSPRQSTS